MDDSDQKSQADAVEINARKRIKWPPEHMADKQLTMYLQRAREAGDVFREQAYDAEIKRRFKLRNAHAAIRADSMEFLRLLTTVHQLYGEKLPEELNIEIRTYLVKHGIIVDLPS